MATATDNIERDLEVIGAAVRDLDRPQGVGVPKAVFGEDHTGDDGVWLTFPTDVGVKLTKRRVRDLAEFSIRFSRDLYDRRIGRIPHIEFSEVKKRVTRRGSS